MMAAFGGHSAVVAYLLSARADVRLTGSCKNIDTSCQWMVEARPYRFSKLEPPGLPDRLASPRVDPSGLS